MNKDASDYDTKKGKKYQNNKRFCIFFYLFFLRLFCFLFVFFFVFFGFYWGAFSNG